MPSAALVVLTLDANYARQAALRESFLRSRTLWFPLAAFDGSDEAVSYSLRHLENMDFTAMMRGHQAALKLVEETSRVTFEGRRGTDVSIAFGSEVEFTMLKDLKVPVGDQMPLASFFEFETEIEEHQFGSGHPLPFVVNGTIRPSGILCAHGPGQFGADNPIAGRGRQLASRASAAPTTVTVREGAISCIEMDTEDVTAEFAVLAGPYGLHISEFAIGFYRPAGEVLDWGINSPVNEGAQGIHFGIGDGYSGLHFDFVSDDVTPS